MSCTSGTPEPTNGSVRNVAITAAASAVYDLSDRRIRWHNIIFLVPSSLLLLSPMLPFAAWCWRSCSVHSLTNSLALSSSTTSLGPGGSSVMGESGAMVVMSGESSMRDYRMRERGRQRRSSRFGNDTMSTSRWSSPILPPVTTLDLHGKLVEDAIAEVTLFLERIRTYHHHAAALTGGGGTTCCYVQIITGSGSHSRHGPILRSAVQKLLDKRRMIWKLEHGGGSFQVDALSGDDLYDPGEATDSKVLIAEEEDFRQLASSRRGYGAGSYGEMIELILF